MSPGEPIPEYHEGLYSGHWRGFYRQGGRAFPQKQRMEFADGIVRGEGADGIGNFVIEGEYRQLAPHELRIGWIKTYTNAHSVLYLGVYDGLRIRGTWDIGGWGDEFEFAPDPHDPMNAGDSHVGQERKRR